MPMNHPTGHHTADLLRVQPEDDGEVRHLTASEWREVLHHVFIWMIDTSKDADAHLQSPVDTLTEALANVGKDYGLVADERGAVFKIVFDLWFNSAPGEYIQSGPTLTDTQAQSLNTALKSDRAEFGAAQESAAKDLSLAASNLKREVDALPGKLARALTGVVAGATDPTEEDVERMARSLGAQ